MFPLAEQLCAARRRAVRNCENEFYNFKTRGVCRAFFCAQFLHDTLQAHAAFLFSFIINFYFNALFQHGARFFSTRYRRTAVKCGEQVANTFQLSRAKSGDFCEFATTFETKVAQTRGKHTLLSLATLDSRRVTCNMCLVPPTLADIRNLVIRRTPNDIKSWKGFPHV